VSTSNMVHVLGKWQAGDAGLDQSGDSAVVA
jgi:hypothetical protein